MASLPTSGVDLKANLGPTVPRTVVPVAVLATIAVACRLYSRKLKNLQFAAHDYLIIGGLVLAWGCAAITIIMAHYGMGRHIQAVPAEGTTLFSFIFIFDTAILLIKASIILFYRQLFPVRTVRIISYAVGVVVVAWWLLTVFMGLFLCTPVAAQWDKSIPNYHCISDKKYYIATAVPNTLTDVVLLGIPLFKVWRLQMRLTQRVLISGIFLLGIFECAVSIVRIVYLFQIGLDFTWDVTNAAIWGSLEPSVGVICACLPTMLPFIESFFFKPIRSITTSLQGMLRPSHADDSDSPSRRTQQKSEDSKNWQRLQEHPPNWTDTPGFQSKAVVEGGGDYDAERDAVLLDHINVRKDVDVESDDLSTAQMK
ncbi:hypothetical protein MMC28_011541 [Mycoblastus sanguinarius]|nr:hypothetical protein [Mycoblastus sanguinarius]